MQLPYLVVLTGYPRSGKSTVRDHLVDTCGFSYVSSDEICKGVASGLDFAAYHDHPLYQEMEDVVFFQMNLQKLRSLHEGNNTVVDCTAMNHTVRSFLLNTKTSLGNTPANKSLVWLQADRDILRARSIQAGREVDTMPHWDEHWEDPVPSEEYRLLTYTNNTSEDLERMLQDLTVRFGFS
jgi:predicted kinase